MIGETSSQPVAANDPTPLLATVTDLALAPAESGGRDGLDPTRYGDWEKNGRCIDF